MRARTDQAGLDGFQLLLSVEMDMAIFGSNWAYCDRLSSYMAQMISHNRTDSLLFANLFSSAFNELLETAFRIHSSPGRLLCAVERSAEVDRVHLSIPANAQVQSFYESAVDRLTQPDAAEQYRQALFTEGAIDPGIGLFELAIDYDARFGLELGEQGVLHITADLALDKAKI